LGSKRTIEERRLEEDIEEVEEEEEEEEEEVIKRQKVARNKILNFQLSHERLLITGNIRIKVLIITAVV